MKKKGLGFGLEKGWNAHSNDLKRLEKAGGGFRKGLELAF